MKSISVLGVFLGVVVQVLASPVPQSQTPSTGGSGQYGPASWYRDYALPRHSIYAPSTIPTGAKLPVLIWGNGGCSADAGQHLPFLLELASHGNFVIANGQPGQSGQTNSSWQKESLDWIVKNGGTGNYSYVDTSKVAVAGMSCGGLEAYDFTQDARIATIGIFNSGFLDVNRSNNEMKLITKPIFYFLGGSSDIAYANGERDYDLIPASTPRWKGNLNVGHGGTYLETNGGRFGVAAANWLAFTLKGSASAAAFFTGDGAKSAGWEVESAALEKIVVS